MKSREKARMVEGASCWRKQLRVESSVHSEESSKEESQLFATVLIRRRV